MEISFLRRQGGGEPHELASIFPFRDILTSWWCEPQLKSQQLENIYNSIKTTYMMLQCQTTTTCAQFAHATFPFIILEKRKEELASEEAPDK